MHVRCSEARGSLCYILVERIFHKIKK